MSKQKTSWNGTLYCSFLVVITSCFIVGNIHAWRPLARFLPIGGDQVDDFGNRNGQYATRKLIYSSSRIVLDVYPSNTSQCYEKIIEPYNVLQMDEKSLVNQQVHILQRPFKNGVFTEQLYRTKQIVNRYNVTNQLYTSKYAITQSPQPFKILQIPNGETVMCRRDGYLTSLSFDDHYSPILYSTGFSNLLDCEFVEDNGVLTIFVIGIQNVEGGSATATIMKIDWINTASRSTTLFTLQTFDTAYFATFVGKIMLTRTQSMVIVVGSTMEDIFRLYHVTHSFIFYVGTIIDLQQYLPRVYRLPSLSTQLGLPCQLFQETDMTLYTVVNEDSRSTAVLEIKGELKGSFSVSSLTPILNIPKNESNISNIFLFSNNINDLLTVSYANYTRFVSHIYRVDSSSMKYETKAYNINNVGNILNLKQVNYCNRTDVTVIVEIRETSVNTFTLSTKNIYPEIINDTKKFVSDWRPKKIDGKKIQVLDLVFDEGNRTYTSSNSSSIADIRYDIENTELTMKASVIHLLRIDFDVKSFSIRTINSLSIMYFNLPSTITKDLSSFFPYSNNSLVFTINTVNNSVESTEVFEFDTLTWTEILRKEFKDVATGETMYIFDNNLYLTNSTTGVIVTSLENYNTHFITFPNLTQQDPLDKTIKISTILHKNMSEYLETVPKPTFPHQQYIFFATSRGYIYQMTMEGEYSKIVSENTIYIGNSSWIPMSGLFFNLHLYLTFYPGHILDIEFKEVFENGKYHITPHKKDLYELAFLNDLSMGKSTTWTAQLDCYAEYTYFTGDKEAIYKLEMRNVPLSLYDIESVNINNIADMKASDNSGMLYLIDYNGNILIRDISLYPDVRFYLVIAVISLLSVTLLVISIVCIIPVIMRYRRRKLISEKRKTFRELVKNKTTNSKFIIERRLYIVDPFSLFVKKKYFSPDIIVHRSVGPHGIMFEASIHNSPVMLKKIKTALKVYRQDLEEEAMKLVSLRHKNVQKYVGLSVDDQNNKYIIYEKLPDYEGSLREYIDFGILKSQSDAISDKLTTYDKFSLSFQDKLILLRDTVNGLQYLHKKGITMQGNLKPSNILIHFVEPEETTNTIQEHLEKSHLSMSQANFVSGRNVAKLTDYAFLHYCKNVEYKPDDLIYTSPEALDDETSKSEASGDVYSLSLVIYSLIFMKSPFEDTHSSPKPSKPVIPFDKNNDESVWEWFSQSYNNDDYLGMLNYSNLNHDTTKAKITTVTNIKKIVSFIEKMWTMNPSSRPNIREIVELFKEVVV